MSSSSSSIITEKALALKAIIQYMLNRQDNKLKLEDICNSHPREINRSFTIETLRAFMRANTGYHVYQKEYQEICLATQKIIDDRHIFIPKYMRSVLDQSGIVSKPSTESNVSGIPDFIDLNAVTKMSGISTMVPFVNHYGGCWRTYRMSSDQSKTHGNTMISVGLLHIKPLKFLLDENLEVPEFSLYQRAGEPPNDAALRTYGIFISTAQRFTLLAEGPRAGAGMRDIGLMTWRHVDEVKSRQSRRRPIAGIYCLPNADGQRIVATYFCANFVDGSDEFTKEKYEAFRQQEIEKKHIGTMEYEEIRADSSLYWGNDTLISAFVKEMQKKTAEEVTFQV